MHRLLVFIDVNWDKSMVYLLDLIPTRLFHCGNFIGIGNKTTVNPGRIFQSNFRQSFSQTGLLYDFMMNSEVTFNNSVIIRSLGNIIPVKVQLCGVVKY